MSTLPKSTDHKQYKEAKERALRYLQKRDRSERKIIEYLQKNNIEIDVIEDVMLFLKKYKFIDDERYGYQWVEYRLENSPIGSLKIQYELTNKGLHPDVISRILEKTWKAYNEFDLARSLAMKKANVLDKTLSQKELKSIHSLIIHRGFPPDMADQIVEGLNKWD